MSESLVETSYKHILEKCGHPFTTIDADIPNKIIRNDPATTITLLAFKRHHELHGSDIKVTAYINLLDNVQRYVEKLDLKKPSKDDIVTFAVEKYKELKAVEPEDDANGDTLLALAQELSADIDPELLAKTNGDIGAMMALLTSSGKMAKTMHSLQSIIQKASETGSVDSLMKSSMATLDKLVKTNLPNDCAVSSQINTLMSTVNSLTEANLNKDNPVALSGDMMGLVGMVASSMQQQTQ